MKCLDGTNSTTQGTYIAHVDVDRIRESFLMGHLPNKN